MTSFNHPLLLEHYSPDIPDMFATAATAVCSAVAASAPMGSYTKLDADFSTSGLQNGDLLVVFCSGGTMSDVNFFPHMNPGRYTVATHGAASDSDYWMGVDILQGNRNHGGVRNNEGTYIKFWHTGDPTVYSFFSFLSGGAERCIRAYVVRGVSKRVPVDFINDRMIAGPSKGKIWLAANLRSHSNYALVQWNDLGTQYHLNSGKYDPDPPFSLSDPALSLRSPGVEIVATDQHNIDDSAGFSHHICFFQTTKQGIQDLVPDKTTLYLQETNQNPVAGLTTYNCYADDTVGTWNDRITVGIVSDSGVGDVEHWVGRSVHLDIGDVLVARIRAGNQQGATASSSFKWAHGVIEPDSTYRLLLQTSSGITLGTNFTEYDGPPTKWSEANIRYSGIPSYSGGEIILIHRATQAGTHHIRSWVVNSSTPADLQHDFGGTPPAAATWRYHTYSGMALGINRWPEFLKTPSTGITYGAQDDLMGSILWPWIEGDIDWDNNIFLSDGVTPATATDDGFHYDPTAFSGGENNRSAGTCWTYTAKDYLTTPDTFIPFKMMPAYDYVPGIPFDADGLVETQLGTNVYAWSHSTYSSHSRSNRIIHPWYYATEVATTKTWGNYYFEVTCTRAPSAGQTYDGVIVAQAGWHNPRDLPINTNNIVNYPFRFGFTDDGRFGGYSPNASHYVDQGDIALNDVVGFHLDFENEAFSIYLNGSLVVTTPIDPVNNTHTTYDMNTVCFHIWRHANFAADQPSRYSYNFTGPFVYTKPTGAVAVDWTNEVA